MPDSVVRQYDARLTDFFLSLSVHDQYQVYRCYDRSVGNGRRDSHAYK